MLTVLFTPLDLPIPSPHTPTHAHIRLPGPLLDPYARSLVCAGSGPPANPPLFLTLVFILALPLLENECDMKPHTTGCGQPQRVPAKVRLDGEAELTASLLAQFLLLAVLFAVRLALTHVRRLLVAL